MGSAGWLSLALLAAYGVAAAAPLLRGRTRGRGRCRSTVVGWCLGSSALACTLLVPSERVWMRAACAFALGDLAFRLVESFRHWEGGGRGFTLREYYRFLIPFPALSAVYPDHKRRLTRPESPWPQVFRIIGGVVGVAVALAALELLGRVALVRSSFALNHAVMLLTFVLAVESLSRALCGLERLAGFDTTPIIRNAYLSRSVSEFWRRYNGRIHDWLYLNVFRATGGRRHPACSVLLVFLVSGLFHEAAFALATSRLTGYQFVFFTIQGPAALASGAFERLARRGVAGRVVAHAATILFLAVTSVFFFDGVGRIFPFLYVSRSPLS